MHILPTPVVKEVKSLLNSLLYILEDIGDSIEALWAVEKSGEIVVDVV
jgi:hypothetical protein